MESPSSHSPRHHHQACCCTTYECSPPPTSPLRAVSRIPGVKVKRGVEKKRVELVEVADAAAAVQTERGFRVEK